jgi:hypothetical protein
VTTREEVHALIDRVPDEELAALAENLRARWLTAAGPRSLGLGRSGHSDTSARADEILWETGFGE